METISALLALCAGNSPVTVNSPHKGQWRGTFDVFFDLHLNKRLRKQSWGRRFGTQSRPLWRHCNEFHWRLFHMVPLTIRHHWLDKGLTPSWRQAIMATNDGLKHICVIRPLWVHNMMMSSNANISRYWPFVREIHWSPVDSPHTGQLCGALIFSLICAWTNRWVNNRYPRDLRRHCAYYDVTVMRCWQSKTICGC